MWTRERLEVASPGLKQKAMKAKTISQVHMEVIENAGIEFNNIGMYEGAEVLEVGYTNQILN